MNSKLNDLFIFAVGAAIGSLVTYKIVKDRYERILEEIEYDVYDENDDVTEINPVEENEDYDAIERARKLDLREYADQIRRQNYGQVEFDFEDEEVGNVDGPYVITPEEFGENDGYGIVSLYYYADGVVADTNNELVDYVEDVVGLDFMNHYGEYEDDSVFIRNDRLKTDYEILRCLESYSDAVNTAPHDVEDE